MDRDIKATIGACIFVAAALIAIYFVGVLLLAILQSLPLWAGGVISLFFLFREMFDK
jgi:formate-dependent nitrite reductase membrane component NrfD